MDITSIDSNIVVENEENKSISVQNKDIIVANSEPEFEVTVQRKEYSIVGDELYIPKRYEDAPQWIRDLIGTVTEESFNQKITELNSLTQTLNQLIVELDVAKNTYTQSILSSNDIDERINTAITTLNSSLANSDATIVELLNTKVTSNDASSIASDVISASINSGAINALTSSIETASVDRDSALANDISLVHSELSGDIEGNADAITSLNTSVTNINNTLTAQSVDITNLTTEVNNGTNTWAESDSTLENSLTTYITNEGARVESKWAYNSTVKINGVSYSSGFGLATSLTSGSGLPTGQSEFWIKADKFKLMSADGLKKSSYSPFTVDSVTGEINFNGKVTFSNITNVPQLGSTPQEVVTAINNAETTTINGAKITTGSITAAQIQANSISADRLLAGANSTTVWTGGGLVSQNFNGNAAGSIGSPTKGFRLSSNANGTSADPNIYGAYIQGSTIDVTDMKVRASGYQNNFGRISYAAKNITVFMPNYGSGYAVNRLCSRALGIVKIDCWARGYDDRVIISLQCTTDWTNWTTIRTHSSLVAGMTDNSHVTIVFSEILDNSWFSDNNLVGFRMVDAGSEQPATHVFSDIVVSIFNS